MTHKQHSQELLRQVLEQRQREVDTKMMLLKDAEDRVRRENQELRRLELLDKHRFDVSGCVTVSAT